jgi:PAS domain S-box-containing protein
LFDTLPIPVFARDLDGRFMTCNKAYERFFGMTRKSLIGKTPWDVFPFTIARTYIASDHEVLENRQAKTYETKVIRADGTTRRAVTDKTCYLDAAGEPAGIVGTMVDVTEQILIAEELAAARDAAEEALATERLIRSEQRNFLTMISHEFRVPLAIIEGSTQLLGMYCDETDEAQDEEAKIFRAVRRMTDLIDIFLADDRLDSTSLNIITGPCDITSMIRELCQEMEEFSGAPRISLTLDPGVHIVADATLLKVAFTNIINNAIKFSTSDSIITVDLINKESTISLTVTDNGPGISNDDACRVFEKFFRSTSTNRIGGAGLGLYIVKRIIDLHQGSIVLDSRPGQGCTVRISLPLNSA